MKDRRRKERAEKSRIHNHLVGQPEYCAGGYNFAVAAILVGYAVNQP
ncbi:hypothetical protein SOVF_060770 [Spinacia oleracea]|nr:hypothetical protein SOVF_060770 [Spinacia oleracea]